LVVALDRAQGFGGSHRNQRDLQLVAEPSQQVEHAALLKRRSRQQIMHLIDHHQSHTRLAQQTHRGLLAPADLGRRHQWRAELAQDRAEESRLVGTGGHLHLEHRDVSDAVVCCVGGERRMIAPELIIDFPLLVGPTRSKFDIRVRLGWVSKSFMAVSAASARP
jgi:hypothetical protein